MPVLPTISYKICTVCRTFNHAHFIKDAMNGFCIQETNFPFVAIIIDDASTDGEPEIISQYLEDHFDMAHAQYDENDDAKIIAAIHKNNSNCHFLVILLKYNFYSIKKAQYPLYKGWYENVPYITMCEGDDYWTDPLKLQKQVDYIETHPKCGLIYTDFDVYVQRSNKLEKDMIKTGRYPEIRSFEDHLLKAGYIAPPSWLYRKDKNVFHEINNNPRFVDYTFSLAIEFFKHSQVHYMDDTTCVYRILQNSASHHTMKYHQFVYAKGIFKEQLYFCTKYQVSPTIVNSIKKRFYRKYYKQILAFEGVEERKELQKQAKLFKKNGLKASIISSCLTSNIIMSFFAPICRFWYKVD